MFQRLLTIVPGWSLSKSLSLPAARAQVPSDATLHALAEVVLPAGELGADGIERAVEDFRGWSAGFSSEAERDHPYLWSDDLRYGPADPRPRWRGQLEALEAAARDGGAASFSDLSIAQRRRLLESELPPALPEGLDDPAEAGHVGIALLARFVSTPGANDLCYRSAIGRHSCRGLPSVGSRPGPLDGGVE